MLRTQVCVWEGLRSKLCTHTHTAGGMLCTQVCVCGGLRS